ncbi:putative MATH/TRAF domain-containing protein [Dioscorea sansibarensis]
MDYVAFLAVGVISKLPSTVGLLSSPWASSPSFQARIGYILIYPQGCDVYSHLSLFVCVANHHKLLPGWSHFTQFTIAVVNQEPKSMTGLLVKFNGYLASVLEKGA